MQTLFCSYSRAYLRAVYGNACRSARIIIGLDNRQKIRMRSLDIEQTLEEHSWVCEIVRDRFLPVERWTERPACEAGTGNSIRAMREKKI